MSIKSDTHTINIAIIGAGAWGKNLIRNFHTLGVLRVVCDTDEKVLKSIKSQYPDIAITNSFIDLITQSPDNPITSPAIPSPLVEESATLLGGKGEGTITQLPNDQMTIVDAVVIATPAATHYKIAKEALLAGKNVYVEKPLALNLNEANELIQLAEQKKKILMVGHILRYHPAVNKLKELIDSGELGKIQYIYSNRLNIGKIRTEENILWSFAPHDISVILYLLNEEPEIVCATGGSYLQKDIVDVTLTTMDFPSGVKSHIFVSWLHPFKEQKLVVVGDKKMAVFDDISKEKLFLYPHRIEWQNRIPVACKAEPEIVSFEMAEPLKLECQHFIDCVINNKTPLTDGYEGLRVLKILTAAQQSLNTNGQKILLNHPITQSPNNLITQLPNTLPSSSVIPGGAKNLSDIYIHPTASGIPSPLAGESATLIGGKGEGEFYVHPTSFIGDNCKIGKGTKIWHHCQIQSGAQIGENCVIGHNCFVGGQAKLGNGVKLECNIDVWDLVTLEDYVFVGPSAVFTNDINPRAKYPKKKFPQYGKWIPTLVKEGASIGANATIVCGNTIGRWAMVGAGAVVTKDVPDYAIVAGVPARVIGYICECGNKLRFIKNKAICPKCDSRYQRKSGKVIPIT